MVNNLNISQENKNSRLSMRNSVMVWVAGAVLGWIVAVASVWTVMDNSNSNIAKNTPSEAEKMEQIMPASGNGKDKR